ncbi:MAG: site-specific integrase, partial [Treponema sp.]|nr:site-specific integrase [Treponema sp.]
MTSDEALKKFYANLIMVDGRSELTAQTYKTAAKEFLGYLERQNIDLPKVTVRDLLYYLSSRKTDGCSELTLAKDISALRALGSFLVVEGVWPQNEALVLDRPKARRSLPRGLSVE